MSRTARIGASLVAALVAMAVAAPAAAADDASVYAAWTRFDADFERLGNDVRRGLRVFRRSNFRRGRPALRALAETRRKIDETAAAVSAEQPSSDPGSRAKALALRSLESFKAALTATSRGVRAGMRRRLRVMVRRLRRADELLEASLRYERRARARFREAGVQVQPR